MNIGEYCPKQNMIYCEGQYLYNNVILTRPH